MCPTPTAAVTTDRPKRTQGQNWITPKKRLAIYLRDGFCCAYCGKGIEAGVTLTLDHLKPYSLGGAISDHKNLITACLNCNSARGNRSLKAFVEVSAAYHQREGQEVLAYIRRQVRRVLKTKVAGEMLAQRGSCRKVLDEVQGGRPV
jgi:5-methylcytosine-specific restriction endonuclease McrA